jgi:hypothetical protein
MIASCCHCLFVAKSKRKRKKGNDTPVPRCAVAFFTSNVNKRMKEDNSHCCHFLLLKHKKRKKTQKQKNHRGKKNAKKGES